jgi:hypothetical protein
MKIPALKSLILATILACLCFSTGSSAGAAHAQSGTPTPGRGCQLELEGTKPTCKNDGNCLGTCRLNKTKTACNCDRDTVDGKGCVYVGPTSNTPCQCETGTYCVNKSYDSYKGECKFQTNRATQGCYCQANSTQPVPSPTPTSTPTALPTNTPAVRPTTPPTTSPIAAPTNTTR